jgi:hypothetical protein
MGLRCTREVLALLTRVERDATERASSLAPD